VGLGRGWGLVGQGWGGRSRRWRAGEAARRGGGGGEGWGRRSRVAGERAARRGLVCVRRCGVCGVSVCGVVCVCGVVEKNSPFAESPDPRLLAKLSSGPHNIQDKKI
jgi:hypothetical protein